jgi:serine/threonine protein phosphatase PrpC
MFIYFSVNGSWNFQQCLWESINDDSLLLATEIWRKVYSICDGVGGWNKEITRIK